MKMLNMAHMMKMLISGDENAEYMPYGQDANFDWRNADVLSQKYLPQKEQEQLIDADPMVLDMNDAAMLNQLIEENAAIAK